jgi:hypothetical protein
MMNKEKVETVLKQIHRIMIENEITQSEFAVMMVSLCYSMELDINIFIVQNLLQDIKERYPDIQEENFKSLKSFFEKYYIEGE